MRSSCMHMYLIKVFLNLKSEIVNVLIMIGRVENEPSVESEIVAEGEGERG